MDIPNGSDATGNSVSFKLYKTESIEIDGIKLSGNVLSMDFRPLRRKVDKEVNVILGFNYIRQLNWMFHLPDMKWSVEKIK